MKKIQQSLLTQNSNGSLSFDLLSPDTRVEKVRERVKGERSVTQTIASIDKLSHDGRGIARIDGKTTFITGSLPGEQVLFRYTRKKKSFDEGEVLEILSPSPDRVTPPCVHAQICGGCSLQHITQSAQVQYKQAVLLELLEHAGLKPHQIAAPLIAQSLHYRAKARISVRYVEKKQRVLVGFREKSNPRYIADIQSCMVLDGRVGLKIELLKDVIQSLESSRKIAQIEVTAGDEYVALIFRNMSELSSADQNKLCVFGEAHGFWIYLQPGGEETVARIYPLENDNMLSYRLTSDTHIRFFPGDFIQVNPALNRLMVLQAIEWMDLQASDKVLDLFCGLGNFSLPLAKFCQHVTGIEGDEKMIVRARENAVFNALHNTSFHAANLMSTGVLRDFSNQGINKILIDPPRAGAVEIVQEINTIKPERIVYVSCHPATLVRDAEILVNKWGYKLARVGVMDMFSHTAHVESMALFMQ